MRIAVDLRPLQSHNRFRGIGFFTGSIIEHISLIDHLNSYIFIIDQGLENPSSNLNLDKGFNYMILPISSHKGRLSKIVQNIFSPELDLREIDVDCFLQTDFSLGRAKGNFKQVCVFYDLIPLIFKNEYFAQNNGKLDNLIAWRVYHYYLYSIKKFDHIITISESSKSDLQKYLHISPDTVSVVYLADTSEYIEKSAKKMIWDKSRFSKSYLLYVGSCDFRKNIKDAIAMLDICIKEGRDYQLILAGKDFEDGLIPIDIEHAIKNSPNRKAIIKLGFIDNHFKKVLYKYALAFIFPSLYEGFGLPILEAMSNRCPVVTYTNSSLREVGGSAALYVADPEDACKILCKLDDNPEFRQKVIEEGIKNTKRFNWDESAKLIIKAIEDVR